MTKYTLFCSLASTAICVSPSFAQQNGYPADVQLRIGMCDGSAAVALGNDRFVVADDEDNVLRVYPRGQGQAPLQAFDMNAFLQPETAKPETDTEGATLVGNRIYWITSHGRNKNGAVRGSRYRFWATQWEARGERVASRVNTGMMFINNIDWSDAELPFGGIKYSGYGRELGDMGIQEFVNKKLVRVHDMVAPLV